MEVNGSQAAGSEGGETRAQDVKVRAIDFKILTKTKPTLGVVLSAARMVVSS